MEACSICCSSSSTCLEYCRRSTPCAGEGVTQAGGAGRNQGTAREEVAAYRLQRLLHQGVLKVGLDVNWG